MYRQSLELYRQFLALSFARSARLCRAVAILLMVQNESPPDNTEAERWFRLAGDQGHADAQYKISSMYASGVGVAKEAVEAARSHR